MAMPDRTTTGDEPAKPLSETMGLTEDELVRRKKFLEFGDADVKRLGSINELAHRYADGVIDDFYRHLLGFEDTRAFFADPELLQRVRALQKDYFLRLTQGTYDIAYSQNRLQIGATHERIGLPIKSYLGMYNFYLRAVALRVMDAYKGEPAKAMEIFLSLTKLTFLDIGLAIDTYIFSRERTIRDQQEAIQELPTPVLPMREGLLIVPIIGLIDSHRARQLTEQLLTSIRANRAKVVVIDITGVQSLDTKVANHMVQTIEAARLMGAQTIIAGVSPDIARTMVTLGIDLTRVSTVGDLQGGIERAEHLLGYVVTRERRAPIAVGGG
jgi:rsbT co-antagonist protein RsbR